MHQTACPLKISMSNSQDGQSTFALRQSGCSRRTCRANVLDALTGRLPCQTQLRVLGIEARTTTTRALRIWVVELEAAGFEGLKVVHFTLFEVHGGHTIHENLQPVKVVLFVHRAFLQLKLHLVLEAGAPAAAHAKAYCRWHGVLRCHNFLDFSHCRCCHLYAHQTSPPPSLYSSSSNNEDVFFEPAGISCLNSSVPGTLPLIPSCFCKRSMIFMSLRLVSSSFWAVSTARCSRGVICCGRNSGLFSPGWRYFVSSSSRGTQSTLAP